MSVEKFYPRIFQIAEKFKQSFTNLCQYLCYVAQFYSTISKVD